MPVYEPGPWNAIVTERDTVILSPDVPPPVLGSIWSAMGDRDGLAAALEGLVGAFGASMGALPPFVVIARDASADLRIIVRGSVSVHVVDGSGNDHTVTGLGAPTWNDRVIADAVSVDVSLTATRAECELPIRDGVVGVGALRWRADAASDAVAPSGAATPPQEQVAPSAPAASLSAAAEAEPAPVEAEPAPRATASAAPDTADEPPSLRSVDGAGAVAEAAIDAGALTRTQSAFVPDETVAEVPDETYGYDDLIFGETRMSTSEDAAVRADADLSETGLIAGIPPVPPPPASRPAQVPAVPPAAVQGDHDGETISAERLAELQAQLDRGAGSGLAAGSLPVFGDAAATLVVSTGERLVLDRGAVVGRRPRALRATGVVPHLVTVPSPHQDISRDHVEIRVEGSNVLAVDLDTTNGTRLLREGQDPVRLQPGQAVLLVAGDRLDLGDEVELSFEGVR